MFGKKEEITAPTLTATPPVVAATPAVPNPQTRPLTGLEKVGIWAVTIVKYGGGAVLFSIGAGACTALFGFGRDKTTALLNDKSTTGTVTPMKRANG